MGYRLFPLMLVPDQHIIKIKQVIYRQIIGIIKISIERDKIR